MGFWAGYLLDSRLLWLDALDVLCGLCDICAFGFGWVWVGWLFACEGFAGAVLFTCVSEFC